MAAAVAAMLLAMAALGVGAPTITFPINSQVPPIARVGVPFQLVFSASTFSSTTFSVQYALSDAPSWLQLDSISRTLSGTPTIRDTGPFNFNLVATDDTGSTSLPVTLIVSSDAGPGLGLSISNQLPAFGAFSPPDTLLFYPSTPISISFTSNTFTNTNENTVYYALCTNNTPLPSWINFDPSSLFLAGNTPDSTSPIELPQMFEIKITASDYVGFSDAVVSFQLIISSHELTFGNQSQVIRATPGKPFNYSGIKESLQLDGIPIEISDLQGILAECPPWMSLNPQTLILSGTPPTSASSQNISVLATDIYGDEANTTILISVQSPLNLIYGTIGILVAAIGSEFNYSFSRPLFPVTGSSIAIDLGTTGSWLHFDTTTLSLSGNVPTNLKPQTDQLNLTVSKGNQIQSQVFSIALILGMKGTATSTYILPSQSGGVSSTVNPNPTSTAYPSSSIDDSSTLKKAIAVAVSVPLVVMCLIGLYWCLRKRGRKGSSESCIRTAKRKISRPLCQEKAADQDELEYPILRHRRLPSKAPRIEISNVATDATFQNARSRASVETTEVAQTKIRDPWQTRSLITETIIPAPYHFRPESLTLPQLNHLAEDQIPLRRPNTVADFAPCNTRLSQILLSSKHDNWFRKRCSDWDSVNSTRSFFSRATGLGHGRSMSDTSPSMGFSNRSTGYSGRVTIRRVTPLSRSNSLQRQEQLQQYLKKRHHHQSPLFSGRPSIRKVSSTTYLNSRVPSSAVEAPPKTSTNKELESTSPQPASNPPESHIQSPPEFPLPALPHSFNTTSLYPHLHPPPTLPPRSQRRNLFSSPSNSISPSYRRHPSPGKPSLMSLYLKRSRSSLTVSSTSQDGTPERFANAEETEADIWEDINEDMYLRLPTATGEPAGDIGKENKRPEKHRAWLHTSLGLSNPLTVHPSDRDRNKSVAGSILEMSPVKSVGGSASVSLRESRSFRWDRERERDRERETLNLRGKRKEESFQSFRREEDLRERKDDGVDGRPVTRGKEGGGGGGGGGTRLLIRGESSTGKGREHRRSQAFI
ncbi:MAG: hypothetical protein MMC33_001317 [Icmadophila ericetorum]|nr:hypothetical protein [Icmadophila ericetorum]